MEARTWEKGDGRVRLRAWNGLYLDTFGRSDRDGTALSTSRADNAGTQRRDIEYAGLCDDPELQRRRPSALDDRAVAVTP
ncbi:hypothetical protein [Streptomyces sp. UNOB3_S3]|uniref:hypothetical protein n=1 Tax=Streptomyces sp. UNOB3_S3 TaxID=2871682 RepID=UPI001E5E5BEA|nr:hypothetical protein [Streptomyces sp. UNOB3_S3]MCC3777684.1 hypothetical protein [Streptomyces sp. UNOB3_S3]